MSVQAKMLPVATAFPPWKGGLQAAVIVFCAYWLAAEAAFFIGTLSDKIFAPFWPPNIVLLCALLVVPPERRWICIVAAFPAHVVAELRVGMPAGQLLVAFVTNVLVALLTADAVIRLLKAPPWFTDFRKVSLYVVAAGFVCPALVAFGGAFVPILGGGALTDYGVYWGQWFASNALGNLTLGPIALILVSEGSAAFWSLRTRRQLEALLLAMALVITCATAFEISAGQPTSGFLPALLYAPVPLILWFAARFGVKGASAAILIMTVVLVWRTLNGPSLFAAGSPESNALALQIFLICLAAPVLLLGSSVDEARRAVTQLREDEERLAFVAAAANVGIWRYNAMDDRFWGTDHCRSMFGLDKQAVLTRSSILDAVHPDDRHVAEGAITSTYRSADGSPAEFRIADPDGGIRWIAVQSNWRRDETGAVAGTSGVFIDITARKTAETEAETQRRELAHLMRVSQVGELSGSLAHELTQPLTAILANAQAARAMLSQRRPDLDGVAEVLDDIIEEDQRAGEVIHRLRSLLKNGKGNFEPFDLDDLLNSTLRLLHSELIGRRIKANLVIDSDPTSVSGDFVQLQQVLLNLVMNAIEAVNQMTTLRRVITLKSQWVSPSEIEISVADRGTGIGQSDLQRIFEPFFTTKERGLGLGLSICSTIVKHHGGILHLENNADGGATARFRLPAQGLNGGK